MAHILVRNSLNSTAVVKLNTTFSKMGTLEHDGAPRWLLEVATTYPSVSGTPIRPYYIDTINTSSSKVDDLIVDAVSEIASQIDWAPFVEDNDKPYISQVIPTDASVVPIESNIYIDIRDDIPSAGLDMSEATIILNNGVMDFDITNECVIEGDPFYYTIKWEPAIREYSTYNEE